MENTICSMEFDPVATPDGKRFSNPCEAKKAGYSNYKRLRENKYQPREELFGKNSQKTMQTTATGQMSTLDHVLNVGLIFTGISVLVLVGILIFKKK